MNTNPSEYVMLNDQELEMIAGAGDLAVAENEDLSKGLVERAPTTNPPRAELGDHPATGAGGNVTISMG